MNFIYFIVSLSVNHHSARIFACDSGKGEIMMEQYLHFDPTFVAIIAVIAVLLNADRVAALALLAMAPRLWLLPRSQRAIWLAKNLQHRLPWQAGQPNPDRKDRE